MHTGQNSTDPENVPNRPSLATSAESNSELHRVVLKAWQTITLDSPELGIVAHYHEIVIGGIDSPSRHCCASIVPERTLSARLPVLYTYLGHARVTDTYWYLSCTPELMAGAGKRLEQRWDGIR
jgi:hypothetical protein